MGCDPLFRIKFVMEIIRLLKYLSTPFHRKTGLHRLPLLKSSRVASKTLTQGSSLRYFKNPFSPSSFAKNEIWCSITIAKGSTLVHRFSGVGFRDSTCPAPCLFSNHMRSRRDMCGIFKIPKLDSPKMVPSW